MGNHVPTIVNPLRMLVSREQDHSSLVYLHLLGSSPTSLFDHMFTIESCPMLNKRAVSVKQVVADEGRVERRVAFERAFPNALFRGLRYCPPLLALLHRCHVPDNALSQSCYTTEGDRLYFRVGGSLVRNLVMHTLCLPHSREIDNPRDHIFIGGHAVF